MKKIVLFSFALLSLNSFAIESAGSCSLPEDGTCVDYSGDVWSQNQEAVQASCEAENGKYSTGLCTSEGKLGGCVMYEDQPVEHVINFYAPMNADDAKAACDAAGGLWRQ